MRNKECVSEIREDELEELKQLSEFHKLSASVYETIRTPVASLNIKDEKFLQLWKKNAVFEVMSQVQRTDGFLSIYREFIDIGMKPLVVKGIICRNLYEKSDYRPSSDEDMLVKIEEFETYDEIFLKNGFRREVVDSENLPYEISYFNPMNRVYVEMHFSLFPEESKAYGELNREFENIYKSSISENILGTEIYTLNPTQHMLYLICHSFKHFLHGGFGIRQVCDMVLMAEYYKEQIDWKKIETSLKRRKMDGFWDGIIRIASKYLGFKMETIQKEKMDDSDLLIDILKGGFMEIVQ